MEGTTQKAWEQTEFCQQPVSLEENPEPQIKTHLGQHLDLQPSESLSWEPNYIMPNFRCTETEINECVALSHYFKN